MSDNLAKGKEVVQGSSNTVLIRKTLSPKKPQTSLSVSWFRAGKTKTGHTRNAARLFIGKAIKSPKHATKNLPIQGNKSIQIEQFTGRV